MTTSTYSITLLNPTTAERTVLNEMGVFLDGRNTVVAAADINATDLPATPALGQVVLLGNVVMGNATGFEGSLAIQQSSGWMIISGNSAMVPFQTEQGRYSFDAVAGNWSLSEGSISDSSGTAVGAMTADIVLVAGDGEVQALDPNGANRFVDLPDGSLGAGISITAIGNGANTITVRSSVADGGAVISTLQNSATNVFWTDFIHTGTGWHIREFVK